jgi:hypothetical protein
MKLIFTPLIFAGSFFCYAQNLVQNPSFEFHDNDPGTYGNGSVSKAFYWFNDGPGTSDYFHSDFNNIYSRVPVNECGTQIPHSGDAYAGIYTCEHTSVPNVRDYIRNQLASPLIAGNVYQISFYASLADNCVIATSFGAKLSVSPITTFNGFLMLTTEDIHANTLTDKQNWTLVTGTYTASGGEQFLTIGSFFDDLHSDTMHLDSGYLFSYYYIDDVSVTLAGTAGIDSHTGTDLLIFPNPVSASLSLKINGRKQITILNNVGAVVKSQTLNPNESLNVEDLAPGSYLLQIDNETPVRFIKN